MRTISKIIILAIIIELFTTINIKAQTISLQGTISTDTVLNVDTIKVIGDVNILNGITLTIQQGTYVEFQGYYKLNVQGRILAIGEINDTISFSVSDTTGFANTSIVNGGWNGIHFDNTPSTNDTSKLIYCKFIYGKAVGDTLTDDSGGAIYIYKFSNVIISNSLFTNNIVNENGGGIYCGLESSIVIKNNRFIRNISFYQGGGIYIGTNCNTIVYGNIFAYNIAGHIVGGSGGGIYSSSANLNSYCPYVVNNKFFNNKANNGGGIYESNRNIKIINNLICNNYGGGIFNGHQLGYGEYINNTICNNSQLGGIHCYSSRLNTKNNIIWGNINYDTTDTTQIYAGLGASPYYIKYNNIQYGYSGLGNIDTLPLFVQPTIDAGLGYNAEIADWSLQDNSYCINRGTPDTIGLNIPATDIVGNPRIFENRIDMGAFESQLITYIEAVNLTENNFYPNPAYNKLNINTSHKGTAVFEMYDITGRKVFESKITNTNTTLDISSLKTGIFLCRLLDNENVIYSNKIIKQ